MEPLKYFLLAVSLALALSSCKTPPLIPLAAQDFLPAVAHMKEGVLHEYISTYDQGPNKEVVGQLEYSYYSISSDGDDLSIIGLTPALKPVSLTKLVITDTILQIDRSERYYRLDTFENEISSGELLRFDGRASTLALKSSSWQTKRQLKQAVDTTWRGKTAKRFIGQEYNTKISDDSQDTAQLEKLYVAGLGLVYSKEVRTSSTYTRELVRQLSPKQHSDLKATVPKRVAYIDPENTLIPDIPDWAPCRDDLLIADYYNPTPDIGYPGGHYALNRDLIPKLDLTPFATESGYLTIRFVVNCKGEVGRFTTDEADLDLKPKQFPAAAVKDVALAIQKLKGWNTGRVRPDEPLADFYTYITLKFEDGKLIDLLP